MIEYGKVYRIIDPSRCADKTVKVNERVVLSPKYDYGCARDDSQMTGIPHVSVVRATDQEGPFFTTPNANLILADAPDDAVAERQAPEGVRAVLKDWMVSTRPVFGFDCVAGTVVKTNGDFPVGDLIFTNKIKELSYDEKTCTGYVITVSGSRYNLLEKRVANY